MDAARQLLTLGGAVLTELARRGLAGIHEDCTGDVFGASDLPGRTMNVSGRAEVVAVWIEDADSSWVELRADAGISEAKIRVTGPRP